MAMFSLEFEVPDGSKDTWVAELWEAGCEGIVEKEAGGGYCSLRAFFDASHNRFGLEVRFAQHRLEFEDHDERDWDREWRRGWAPFPVGERFFLVPEWLDDPAPEGRIRIPINPGLAFGTGTHEATQLCLETLEGVSYLTRQRCADIGCGSGILTLAMARLGASSITACDVDPVAVSVARENLRRECATAGLFVGSADAMAGASLDLIVSNISDKVAVAMAPDCYRILRPGGIAIVSGFDQYDENQVLPALVASGLELLQAREKNIWRCAVFRRPCFGAG